ncbi:glycosyltransferase family 2 protein [Nocardia nova]|uniref:glycosyltransferase family 2 protein n=1 Tax=Nocardia nova TaxID=37330 RepID=UPI0033F0A1C7
MVSETAHLAVVIVTHNNADDIQACLDSLVSPGLCSDSQVVVRDCGSTDGTLDIAKSHAVVSQAIAGKNVGFGAACNDAVSHLETSVENILILNPDAILAFSMPDLLNYVSEMGDFGCVGIRQLSLSNKLVWSWDEFPGPKLEWKKATDAKLTQRSPEGYFGDRRVDWVMGAFLLIPYRAYISVGGFDERYFMFCEETDLAKRLADVGLPTYYVNRFSYLHDRSDKATVWREVLRLNSRREYDRKWLTTTERLSCQLAHTYRWIRSCVRPAKQGDRRLALPRLLATWNLLHATVPPTVDAVGSRGWGQVRLGR